MINFTTFKLALLMFQAIHRSAIYLDKVPKAIFNLSIFLIYFIGISRIRRQIYSSYLKQSNLFFYFQLSTQTMLYFSSNCHFINFYLSVSAIAFEVANDLIELKEKSALQEDLR